MSIDKNTIDNKSYGPKKENYTGLPEDIKNPLRTEMHDKMLSEMASAEEQANREMLLEAAGSVDDEIVKYCEAFGIEENSITPEKKQSVLREVGFYTRKLASFFASTSPELQKINFNKRKEMFLMAIMPNKIKGMYEDSLKIDLQREQDRVAKNIYLKTEDTKNTLSKTITDKPDEISNMASIGNSSREIVSNNITSDIKSSIAKNNAKTDYIASNKQISEDGTNRNEASKIKNTLAELGSSAKTVEEKNLATILTKNINSNTGELSIDTNGIYLGEGKNLKLSPDGKGLILNGFGFNYEFASFNSKALSEIYNLASSLTFLDNIGMTCMSPTDINKFFTMFNEKHNDTGYRLEISKERGFDMHTQEIILAINHKLGLIPMYDKGHKTKRLIHNNNEVKQALINKGFMGRDNKLQISKIDSQIKALKGTKQETEIAA